MSEPINCFPEYEPVWTKNAKGSWVVENRFRGVDLGHGGYVYAEPGMYSDIALLDSASHHPTSTIQLNYFGEYTPIYKALLDTRIAIKHGDFDQARKMFDGKLEKYLDDPNMVDQLTQALKICLNSTYGMTSASFSNAFTHPNNKNNIVALRGAIFMKMLQDEVAARGFTVAHVKTDSLKIPNATPDIIQFVMEYGAKYGYTFELEAIYDRMCLVNNAVYIAKYATKDKCESIVGYTPAKNVKKGGSWDATGAQFQQPFVFKTLFSKSPIEFWDLCETKEVKSKLYLDFNENLPDVSEYEDEKELREKERDRIKVRLNRKYKDMSDDELAAAITQGHSYQFVGKVGLFTPVVSGVGGAELLVERNGKYSAVAGTKGYRWLESEVVKQANMADKVDLGYYRALVDDAIANISKYGDFEWFVSGDQAPIDVGHPLDPDDVPWLMPCKDPSKKICEECPERDACFYMDKEGISA